jgi:hypothetical protein
MSLALIPRISSLSCGCRNVNNLDIHFTVRGQGAVIILTRCSTATFIGSFSIRRANQALISTNEVMLPGCYVVLYIFSQLFLSPQD